MVACCHQCATVLHECILDVYLKVEFGDIQSIDSGQPYLRLWIGVFSIEFWKKSIDSEQSYLRLRICLIRISGTCIHIHVACASGRVVHVRVIVFFSFVCCQRTCQHGCFPDAWQRAMFACGVATRTVIPKASRVHVFCFCSPCWRCMYMYTFCQKGLAHVFLFRLLGSRCFLRPSVCAPSTFLCARLAVSCFNSNPSCR